MVFPGRFSSGCLRCRQRKVKCDEAKPTCRRCAIYGRECPGYTDQFHFRYRQGSSLAQESCRKPKLESSAAPVQDQLPQPNQTTRRCRRRKGVDDKAASPSQGSELALFRPPEPCYDNISLAYFVRRFVTPDTGDGFPGHMTFLPELFNQHNYGLLETAALSVAQMATYNQYGSETLMVQSYKNYGKAIRLLQDIIRSEEQVTDDRVIMSILLLCTLKDISGHASDHFNDHASGLFYVVQKRGPAQAATNAGAELLFLSLIRLQQHAFVHEDEFYGDPGPIANAIGCFGALVGAYYLMAKTLSLRRALRSCYLRLETETSQPNNDTRDPETVIAECFEILDEFYTWDMEAPKHWQAVFEGRAPPTALGEVGSGLAHYDAETACSIVLVRSVRLVLIMSLIVYHKKLQVLAGWEQCGLPHNVALAGCIPMLEQDIRKSIDDMLSAVPFALGDVEDPNGQRSSICCDGGAAVVIVHSIRLVASCAYATMEQCQRAVDILSRFSSGIGVRSAVGPEQSARKAWAWVQEQDFLGPTALDTLNSDRIALGKPPVGLG